MHHSIAFFRQSSAQLSMNAALAMIEAAAPKDEIEAALAVQMACKHTAAMAVLAKLDVAFANEQRVAAFGSGAARLMRAYVAQVEVLRRLRNGGQQYVRVEHVHINDGGQAVITASRLSIVAILPRQVAKPPPSVRPPTPVVRKTRREQQAQKHASHDRRRPIAHRRRPARYASSGPPVHSLCGRDR